MIFSSNELSIASSFAIGKVWLVANFHHFSYYREKFESESGLSETTRRGKGWRRFRQRNARTASLGRWRRCWWWRATPDDPLWIDAIICKFVLLFSHRIDIPRFNFSFDHSGPRRRFHVSKLKKRKKTIDSQILWRTSNQPIFCRTHSDSWKLEVKNDFSFFSPGRQKSNIICVKVSCYKGKYQLNDCVRVCLNVMRFRVVLHIPPIGFLAPY